MNWHHFRAFLWLRWRLRVNQIKRAGTVNAVFLAILAVAAVCFAAFSLVGSFFLGLYALPEVSPLILLFIWDGLVVAFLFVWMISLAADLQRSEVLSLEKCLHLPVSLTGVFLINYLSSLFSLTLIVFVPPMLGLSLGLAFGRGSILLLAIPLLAAFFLMITALTNQFQGWLASLMANKRRRRTVIVFVTFGIALFAQLPNLVVNVILPKNVRSTAANETLSTKGEGQPSQAKEKDSAADRQREEQTARTARVVNIALPPGWLPLGVMTASEGNPFPALLGFAGLALIGSASLWRSYRTTLRLYTGEFNSRGKRTVVSAPPSRTESSRSLLLERRLPWMSEQATAVALAGFRSLLRAPEAKMMLLGPCVMGLVFGSILVRQSANVPEAMRPLLMTGAMGIVLLGMIGVVGNQFGLDRSGFRVFVLSGASRRDILLGKNLSFVPFTLGLSTALVIALQCLYPMSVDHFAATLLQFVSMFLLFCLAANLLSILAPMPIAAGTLRPVNPKITPILFHLAFLFFVFPLVMASSLLPIGIESALYGLGLVNGVPVCLLLAFVECAAVVGLYFWILSWQGTLLQAREKKILEVVTPKAE